MEIKLEDLKKMVDDLNNEVQTIKTNQANEVKNLNDRINNITTTIIEPNINEHEKESNDSQEEDIEDFEW